MSTVQKCAGCRNTLPKKDYLQCVTCKAKYDLVCANIGCKSINQIEKKDQWKCPECTSKKPKKGNVNTPVRNTGTMLDEGPDLERNTVTLTHNEDQHVTQRSKTLPENAATSSFSEKNSPASVSFDYTISPQSNGLEDLKEYMKELLNSQTKCIREAITGLENTIKAQTSRIEQLESRITILENKSEEIRHSDNSTLESMVTKLQADIAERDQTLLSNDIEVAGIPESSNENCSDIVLTVAKKLGVDLEEKDIVSAIRVGQTRPAMESSASQPWSRPLAVRLARRATRDALLKAARTGRELLTTTHLNLPGPKRSLYINERLTKHNRLLFQKARVLARDSNFKYVWVRDGRVFARQDQGKPRHRLRNECDLPKVFGKYVTDLGNQL